MGRSLLFMHHPRIVSEISGVLLKTEKPPKCMVDKDLWPIWRAELDVSRLIIRVYGKSVSLARYLH